jgi:hypothetical protein
MSACAHSPVAMMQLSSVHALPSSQSVSAVQPEPQVESSEQKPSPTTSPFSGG